MMSGWRARLVTASLVLPMLGCGESDRPAGVQAPKAVPIEIHEGAVCGMIVRDQSAPRAQVLHRDGTRSFLCSIGDLLAYLQAPSPHGAPSSIMVEVMDPSEAPMESHVERHPWIDAVDAIYVVGIPRRGIMGAPVLVYRDPQSAAVVIEGTTGTALGFDELEQWWLDLHRADSEPPSQ